VSAHLELDSDGHVLSLETRGQEMLGDAVKASLKRWVFSVERKRSADIIIEFKLSGPPREANAETFVTFDLPDRVYVVTQPPVCDHCPLGH
jgi:hypothetical protein